MIKLEEILQKHEFRRDRLLEILHDMMAYGIDFHDRNNLKFLAEKLKTTLADIYGTITFYGMIRERNKAKFTITLCCSTVCSMKGSSELYAFLFELLGCNDEGLSKDGIFKLNRVECLGLCDIAPAMRINEMVFGNLTKDRAAAIIEELKNERNYEQET